MGAVNRPQAPRKSPLGVVTALAHNEVRNIYLPDENRAPPLIRRCSHPSGLGCSKKEASKICQIEICKCQYSVV